MTAIAMAPAAHPATTVGRNPFTLFLTDVWVLTKRSIARIRREPETLSDVTIQPVMFVLMFAYVFGGAIGGLGGGDNYHAYLISGMLGMTLAQTAPGTAVAIVSDMETGLIDRFRSLPMSRAAVLTARTIADLLTQVIGGRRGRPGRAGDRLAHQRRRRRRDRGVRARAAVRLRVHLGRRLPRHGAAQPGGRAADRVHHLPAADVHLQRLRADPGHAGLAPAGRGVEPDVVARRRVPLSCSATRTRRPWCTPGRRSTPSWPWSAGRWRCWWYSPRSPSACTGTRCADRISGFT